MSNDMKCLIKCPMCGEVLQKYGEIDPDAGTSIVLGANCPKCGIGNSDIKLWQELIRTRKALDLAKSKLNGIHRLYSKAFYTREDWLQVCMEMVDKANTALEQITALEQKDTK